MDGTTSRGWRSRWAAIGAAVAVSFGAGGFYIGNAATGPASSSFVAITPVRVLDTRTNLGLTGVFTSPTGRDLLVTGSIPTSAGTQVVVPAGATAIALNVTIVGPTANGFLVVRPADATGPLTTSSLNFNAGQVVPNAVTVQLPTTGGDTGKIEITYSAYGVAGPATHVLVDVVGYYLFTAYGAADGDLCTVGGISGSIVSGYNSDHEATTKCFLNQVTTFAGIGTIGSADGATAQFTGPHGVAVDTAGNVYVADTGNNRIRKITSAGVVTTLAGSTSGYHDDPVGTLAQFNTPYGVAVDTAGNVYVADNSNHRIRKITSAGVVTTLAGTGTPGYHDDPVGTLAQFANPSGVAVDTAGNVYVADTSNRRIRKITAAGVVTTIAGSTSGYLDGIGTAAQFTNLYGVAIDIAGNVYVADYNNHRIRQIN